MRIRIKYKGPPKRSVEELEREFKQIVADELLMGGYRIERMAKRLVPVDMGRLRASIHTERDSWNRVRVGTDVSYAKPVEYGSVPHTPPFEPIKKWARRHGIEEAAWAIWQKIRKYGTDPHPYLRPAFFVLKPRILKRMSERVRAFLKSRGVTAG